MPAPYIPNRTPQRHTPQQYGESTEIATGHGNPQSGSFLPPKVPGGSGADGGTSVNTPSMALFADNVNDLLPQLKDALARLQKVQVEPGAFYHANQIRLKVNGANADSGLKGQYIKVLQDLIQSVGDLRTGVKELAAKYVSLEEANNMESTVLKRAMQASQQGFSTLVPDAGGSTGTTKS
ncbi:hypothetical protein ACIQB4_29845 [Streptomyces griseoluteus]|uniref:hypothetical protein n=1 Tax=Streptomyces griseoluteus TaxID=29306 RepID=UPI00380C7D4C